jgi:ribosomal protein S14
LSKLLKKDSVFVGDLQRCEICGTNLTLYPKDFALCPHCQRNICRQCWGGVWAAKSFTTDACAHLAQNDGLTMSSVGGGKDGFHLDLPRVVFMIVLVALAIATLFFLLNLFVF